jgi:hypothetical protein
VNSHIDNVKDAIREALGVSMRGHIALLNDVDAVVCNIADGVFDAQGITEDEQGMTGGYFMLHAGKRCEELITRRYSQNIAQRRQDLAVGAKYTSAEFKAFAVAERLADSDSGQGWYISLTTPVCTYAQAYDGNMPRNVARTNFVNAYYPMYLADYERSITC